VAVPVSCAFRTLAAAETAIVPAPVAVAVSFRSVFVTLATPRSTVVETFEALWPARLAATAAVVTDANAVVPFSSTTSALSVDTSDRVGPWVVGAAVVGESVGALVLGAPVVGESVGALVVGAVVG